MRTYLFADFGKGPRVCTAAARRQAIVDGIGPSAARRWWLVECDSADAGRAIIARAEVGMWHGGIVREGRILDSGGTAQAEGGAE